MRINNETLVLAHFSLFWVKAQWKQCQIGMHIIVSYAGHKIWLLVIGKPALHKWYRKCWKPQYVSGSLVWGTFSPEGKYFLQIDVAKMVWSLICEASAQTDSSGYNASDSSRGKLYKAVRDPPHDGSYECFARELIISSLSCWCSNDPRAPISSNIFSGGIYDVITMYYLCTRPTSSFFACLQMSWPNLGHFSAFIPFHSIKVKAIFKWFWPLDNKIET